MHREWGDEGEQVGFTARHTLQCRECLIDALDDLGDKEMRQKGRKLLAVLSELDPRAFGVAQFQVNERRHPSCHVLPNVSPNC